MVDDAVAIIRARNAVDDVVLISLSYDCIAYAKQTYPEFESGLLFFAEYGDVALLKCDILLAEEQTTTGSFVFNAHEASKQIGAWTVNDEYQLRKVLQADADYIITDEIDLAADVEKQMRERSDLETILDFTWDPM